jgi:hypothetical protein
VDKIKPQNTCVFTSFKQLVEQNWKRQQQQQQQQQIASETCTMLNFPK